MANLPGIAWLDGDGRHIWWRHLCVDGEHTDMLPWPHWSLNEDEGTVKPSIICTRPGCNHHSIPLVRKPPDDFEPRSICPECGSRDTEKFHHAGTFAIPECYYKSCMACNHQWDHS